MMRFDVVVIGGGLAGLSCAIAVAEQGKRCAVVSSGQSALYFSSGSLDLLARLPDGTPVEMPLAALPQLAQQAPQHPYALIGPGRVAALSAGAVDESVGGEWSFAQTLRHLVMATDVWLGRAIQRKEQPYHPAGLPNDDDGGGTAAYEDTSVFSATSPSYDEVLEARASRVAMVGDFLATVTPEVLAEQRNNPHAPQYDETVLSCLHTILDEEWEHHRYAVRDLDALASASEDK